jgi:hypothetical protein
VILAGMEDGSVTRFCFGQLAIQGVKGKGKNKSRKKEGRMTAAIRNKLKEI